MADDDNKELIEFLGKQFEGIYNRLDSIDARLDNTVTKDELEAKLNAAKEETMRHTGVLHEEAMHKMELLAEGIMGINEKLDRHITGNEKEHARLEKMSLINTSDISTLNQRVRTLEGNT